VRRRRASAPPLRAIEATLAELAHEIRTPLTGILALGELLATSELGERERGWAAAIKSTAEHLAMLASLIVDAARADAKGLVLRRELIRPRRLAQALGVSLTARADAKGLAAEVAIAADLPEAVIGDPLRLRGAVENLIDNAVKFTERGRIVLDVTVLGEADGAVRLRFEVRDTGIGIAEDQFDSVFDAFTQVDASSTRRHGGTGLGLAIVKEIAELMGGRVGVDSRLDHGSTFWLELTLQRAAEPVPASVPAATGEATSSAHILLAEDDAVNQMVLAAMLEQLGCRVDIVDDGEAACDAAARTRYDLVFMDCHMPVLDGFDATRRIRDEEAGRGGVHTPIVALTALALAGDRERCLSAGMDDYMTKPVRAAELAAAVERWAGSAPAPS